jgi:hypothetical protein
VPTPVIFVTIIRQVDKDRWTNVKLSQPKPGQFFNRRSCSWYWNSKRKDTTLLQGLVTFAKEDYETAEKHWNLLAELDKEFYAQQKVSGWENATTLARLTWNLHNTKGSLYATPEEMASFKKPKRRLAILVADLYYESEQHQKTLLIYQRLEENREFGTLSKNELAYMMFGIFNCYCWNHDKDEIQYIESRASFSRANSLDLYVAIKDHTSTINQIKYKFLKISNNSFESTEVHIQANIYDLYDFDYSALAIMGYDLARTAATLQIGAVRGVDQVGKIFQVECIIDKIESPLKWQEVISNEYGTPVTVTRKSPYYTQKTY